MKKGKLKNAAAILLKQGPAALFKKIVFRLRVEEQKRVYRKWAHAENTLDENDRRQMRREIEMFTSRPLISVLLPVYDVDEKWLRKCVDSVIGQIYPNWELCVADDCSPSPHVRRVLEEYRDSDDRIKVVFRDKNGHISAASNSALELVTGEFTVLLDHDDELTEHALFYLVKEVNEHPDVQMIYSDEDLIDTRGRRYGPKFKPDWSRDLFYSANLITHLSAYKTSLIKEIGGFMVGLEGSQDYDLALRVIEKIPEDQIRHIPRILYHWRVLETSVAASFDAKPYAHQAARDAIAAHLKRTGKKATVTGTVYNLHRVRYALPDPPPKVSMVLISRAGAESGVVSGKELVKRTSYEPLETIVVCPVGSMAHQSSDKSLIRNTKIFETEKEAESELLNFGASKAIGDVICFADLNLHPLNEDWLEELVSFAIQDKVGAAGAKLLFRNGSILHGGLLIGVGGIVGIAHHGFPNDADGNILRARLVGNFSAVSASCMAVRRNLFEKAGGFDEADYRNRLFDADFCLRLGERGFRIVWTPYAELKLADNTMPINLQAQITQNEAEKFAKTWQSVIDRDPFYNPNLSRENGRFSIAKPKT